MYFWVYVYMHIHIHICQSFWCMSLYSMRPQWLMGLRAHTYICVYMYMDYIYIHIHMCMCVHTCVHVCVYIHTRTQTYIWDCKEHVAVYCVPPVAGGYVCTYICIYVYLCLYPYVYVFTDICICVCIYEYTYIYIHDMVWSMFALHRVAKTHSMPEVAGHFSQKSH